MKNKYTVIVLSIIITLLCVYYLSFTFISQGVQKDAVTYASDSNGKVDMYKKQSYLDSVWNAPVYHLFGIPYTYQEVKEAELNLGLDLQGGMSVTLEVSPVEIIRGRSDNSTDEEFNKALDQAKINIKGTQKNYLDEFYSVYKDISGGKKLSYLFANTQNKGLISLQSSDDDVLKMLNDDIEDAINRSFNILRNRIDKFGTSSPNIQRLQGSGRIQIELPGVDNPERVRKLLQSVAKLEFWEVYELQEALPTLEGINELLVKEQQAQALLAPELSLSDSISTPKPVQEVATDSLDELSSQLAASDSTSQDSTLNDKNVSPLFSLLKSPYGLVYELKDTATINRILKRNDIRSLIPANMRFLWSAKPQKSETNTQEFLELNIIKVSRGGVAPLTGEVITNAVPDFDERGQPSVSMTMNADGARTWKNMTAAAAAQVPKRRIAIVLDNQVQSAPTVQNEIPGGQSQISGNFTLDEAKDLANILKAGALPAPTTIVEDVVIGPTLGKVAQQQGVYSVLGGLLIVVLFMIVYYAGSGFIADLALFFNVFFVLGILAQFDTSLTLPGIAGIVLTMGMAVDANVLIFERIKEEIRNGGTLRQAVSTGFKKAYSSIIDSNVTTFLTGLILFSFGQGPIKGFATTLMIGIVCSFFTAVFITRLIVEFAIRKGDKAKLSFSTRLTDKFLTNSNFDFIGNRFKAYLFSGSFIVIGLVVLIINGLILGVDFKGGRSYVVSFGQEMVPSTVRESLSPYISEALEVKTYGEAKNLKITTSYLIDDESDVADTNVRNTLINAVEKATQKSYVEDASKVSESTFAITSSSKVGATMADDIKNSSMLSVFMALITIFAYVAIRFRNWKFGLTSLIALFHDVLFVLGAYAIGTALGMPLEADQIFIGAMLTIIGYSINDTVVVFDRIREFLGLRQTDHAKSFNEALNVTLSRTLITSSTTLIVVIVLFMFGGAVLKGFSYSLLIGIVFGTYSSIFIASPLVIDLENWLNKKSTAKVAVKAK